MLDVHIFTSNLEPPPKPVEDNKQPESTFSLATKNAAESKARDNVELPYFIGENKEVPVKYNKRVGDIG